MPWPSAFLRSLRPGEERNYGVWHLSLDWENEELGGEACPGLCPSIARDGPPPLGDFMSVIVAPSVP